MARTIYAAAYNLLQNYLIYFSFQDDHPNYQQIYRSKNIEENALLHKCPIVRNSNI